MRSLPVLLKLGAFGPRPIERSPGQVYEGTTMKYRYSSAVLIGPWRRLRREAEQDALRAGQAVLGPGGRIVMRAIAMIEVRLVVALEPGGTLPCVNAAEGSEQLPGVRRASGHRTVPPLPSADFEIKGDHFASDNPAIGLTDDHGAC